MHAYTVIEETPTERKFRFEHLQAFERLDGTTMHVRTAHWEARDDGFPARLWLTDRYGFMVLVDPLADLPDWLTDTAPDWADR